jgi:type I restriction enzyme S subunit
MSEWKEYKLGEIAEIIPGFAFKSKEFGKIGELVIKIKDINPPYIILSAMERVDTSSYPKDKLGKYKLAKGDFVVAMTGATIGKVGKLKTDVLAYINQRVAKIKAKNCVCNDFIYYSISTEQFQAFIRNNIDSNTAQENISAISIGKFPILLPPLPEQKAIAAILSSLDDKIDLLHRQNSTLEKMAETLFRQWFVERRPEPVEGKAKEEWEEETFEKWIHETVGGDWGKESIKGDFTKAVCCLRGTDIADLNNGLPNKTPIRFIKENKYQSICPNDGDLIIEVSGGTENQSTGRICYINNQVKTLFNYPLVFSNFCRMIRIKKPEYSFFVYCYIQYLYNQDEFFNLENGSSGIKNLDYKTLLFDLKYKMPDEDSVIKFHNHVKSLFQKVNQNKIQIRTLSTLRDTLLPKLMSGEVTVQE